MKYTKATVVAIGAFMLVLPLAHLVSAGGTGHEEGDPMIITTPDGDGPISCAVYFADNMVFAPQWRTDGLVRIETMIIDMTDFGVDPMVIEQGTIDLTMNEEVDYETEYPEFWAQDEEGVWYWSQQLYLLENSDRLNETSMVSVSYISVTITEVWDDAPDDYVLHSETFEAGWLDEYPYDRVIFSDLGREVNKHGGLIYGMLWDTAADPENPAPAGEYRVDVQLGKVVVDPEEEGGYIVEIGGDDDNPPWYTVDFAVGHLYVSDGQLRDDAHPYVSLVPNETEDQAIVIGQNATGEDVMALLYDDLGIGLGGVSISTEYNTAWILLGQLMAQGPGGGNGGDSGGTGQGHCGNNPHV